MPPLASELVEATKRYLYSGYQDELNTLNGAMTADATTINLGYDPQGLSRGSTIAIDLEEIFVWSVNQRALTVRRGMNGSVAAVHADGAVVHVKPKFSTFRIFTELNHELRDLSSPVNGLFRIQTVDVPYNPVSIGYDLPGEIISIQEARYEDYVGSNYPIIDQFSLARNMPLEDFPSGTALLLHEAGAPGRIIRVKYRAPFATMAALDSDVAATGLPPTAVDIPPMGAALRLVAPREVKRNFSESQGEPRRSDEVPPGAIASSLRGLGSMRAQRILAEAMRLASQYPVVRP